MTIARRDRPSVGGNDRSADGGFTLLELLVAMAIFTIVIALILPTYLMLNNSATSTAAMTTDDTAIVPALRALTAQVINATAIYSPCASATNAGTPPCHGGASGVPASGFALLVYYNPFTTGTASGMCSQWRLYGGILQDRTWNPASPPGQLAFQAITTTPNTANGEQSPIPLGLNITNTASPAWQPPFSLEGTSGIAANVVDVDLWVQSSSVASSQEVRTSAAAQGVALTRRPVCSPPSTP